MTRRSPEGAFGADDTIPRDDALYACRGTSCHAAGWHGTFADTTTAVMGTMDMDAEEWASENAALVKELTSENVGLRAELDAARARLAAAEASDEPVSR